MRLALFLASGLFLAGCASESDVGPDQASVAADAGAASPALARVRDHGLASLPDRGALVRYDRIARAEARGAFTYRPIELSEAHALNAAASGRAISLTRPDGQPIRIAYQRHEESPDGNWTWIGQTEDGLQAVITFGEKAVFGRIEQRAAEALRIDTLQGRSWMVQVDPTKLIDEQPRDPTVSDALPVPDSAIAAVSKSGAQPTPLATASMTVDLALGYTPGLVARYGGVSQVNTRLNYLVALTNQAYQASKVYRRIRLVHTLQVNYSDSNDNPVALRELTGYACETTSCATQPVPAALQALRDARETYGADLVSLVRAYVHQQHSTCGAAWINRPSIEYWPLESDDEKFGYSVVSDSLSPSGGGQSHSCREDTLAHELGHNMGQAHSLDEPGGGAGAQQFSHGYREATADGFYTIMANPLGFGQFSVPYFSNPRINHPQTGRPLGDYNHDNAQSMNTYMADVAAFRAPVVPFPKPRTRNDFNGDGRSDLIWYNPSQSLIAYWWINDTTVPGSGVFSVGSSFKIVGTGDFDGDGLSDVLWKNEVDDKVYVWRNLGNGQFSGAHVSGTYVQLPTWATGWTVISSSYDFNEDGNDDVVWRDITGKYRIIWLMNGATLIRAHASAWGTSPPFQFLVGGDFDGDRNGDLISVDPTRNWLMLSSNKFGDSETYDHRTIANYDPAWKLAGVTDLNGDGRSDLVWENPSQGLMAYWWMNGHVIQSSGVKTIDPAYRIGATGDYNGDGRGDILWTNANTGLIFLWLSRGDGEFDTPFLAAYSPAWSPIP